MQVFVLFRCFFLSVVFKFDFGVAGLEPWSVLLVIDFMQVFVLFKCFFLFVVFKFDLGVAGL